MAPRSASRPIPVGDASRAEYPCGVMQKLAKNFIQGALICAPVAISLYVVWLVFSKIDAMFSVGVPGLGIVLALATITLVGFAAQNVAGQKVIDLLEAWLKKLPLVALLYTSIRDLIDAFVGEKKRFDKPVAVTLTAHGAKALGFITREHLDFGPLHGHVAVYFPQSYNFAGNVVLVPSEHVTPLDIDSKDLMTFIVSGGVTGAGIEPEPVSLRPSRLPRAPDGAGESDSKRR